MDEKNLEIYNELTKKLLKQAVSDGNKNVVLSPFSILLLLAILADATGSGTREEVAKALGCKDNAEELIRWLTSAQTELMKKDALISSNAVCVREDIKDRIVPGYEEHLKETFGGKLFTTKNMVNAVNRWVNENTKGMIDQIADDSMKDMLAGLINAIVFEAKWDKEYRSYDIEPGHFNNSDGSQSEVTMMNSTELNYIEDPHFTGFTKLYKRVGYSFMALLPKKEGLKYMRKALEGADLTKLFNSRTDKEVITTIPEYTFDFSEDLNDFCKDLGIEMAFSANADFSPMIDEWLKIERILHKAKIQVDRNGTKAAAVTIVSAFAGGCLSFDQKVVTLDRPFIFAIVHDKTGIPVFTGVVNNLEGGKYKIKTINLDDLQFGTEEERKKYIKSTFQKIIKMIGPDTSPIYDSSDEIRQMFTDAHRYYCEQDASGLQEIEERLKVLLGEDD